MRSGATSSCTRTRKDARDDIRTIALFACGDVRLSPVKRIAAALGEGSMAIAFVHECLQSAARGR